MIPVLLSQSVLTCLSTSDSNSYVDSGEASDPVGESSCPAEVEKPGPSVVEEAPVALEHPLSAHSVFSYPGLPHLVAFADVHGPPDDPARPGSAVPLSGQELLVSPPRGALCWVQLLSGWSVLEVAGKPKVLHLRQAEETIWVPVLDAQIMYEKDSKEGRGYFGIGPSPFASAFLRPQTRGPHCPKWQMLFVT